MIQGKDVQAAMVSKYSCQAFNMLGTTCLVSLAAFCVGYLCDLTHLGATKATPNRAHGQALFSGQDCVRVARLR